MKRHFKVVLFAAVLALVMGTGVWFVPAFALADEGAENFSSEDTVLFTEDDTALKFTATISSADAATLTSTTSTNVSGNEYLFLPSNSSINSVVLTFENGSEETNEPDAGGTDGEPNNGGDGNGSEATIWVLDSATNERAEFVSGDALDVSAFTFVNDTWKIQYSLTEDGELFTLCVMQSASVRSMFLISDDPVNEGRDYVDGSVDHSAKATGSMVLVDPDGTVVYNNTLTQIKGRGNSTWGFSNKKPYQIKLGKKIDLLETGDSANKCKTWVLLANAADPTLLRNSISFEIAKALGIEGAPEYAPVDLYYDGEYRGSYLLCEKVQINSGRVDITDLEEANEVVNEGVDLDRLRTMQATNSYGATIQFVGGMYTPDDITGGYLIEKDAAYYKSERCWFETSWGQFVVKSPENASYEEVKFISERMQAFIDATAANEAGDSETSVSEIADAASAAKVLLTNEVAKTPDFEASSTFYFLPAENDAQGSLIYSGPVWDFDTSYGVRIDETVDGLYKNFRKAEGVFYENVWLMDTPEIVNAESQVFEEQLLPWLRAFLGQGSSVSASRTLATLEEEISASQKMNYTIWELSTFYNCLDAFSTYDQNLQYLESYLNGRVNWMAANFTASLEASSQVSMYRLYNQWSGEHLYTKNAEEVAGLVKIGWKSEGEAFKVERWGSDATKVYRLYNSYSGDHHYTMDKTEYDSLVAGGWTGEGFAFYSGDKSGTPVYRLFNPYVQVGTHLYTVDANEYASLPTHGWQQENISFYAAS